MTADHPSTRADEEPQLPNYEPPTVLSYSEEDLIQELGPARACSFSGSVVGCNHEFEPWRKEYDHYP